MSALTYAFIALGVALAVLLIYTGVRAQHLLQNSAELVKASKPFERMVANATTTIVVLGDSTAVGTGATPETSIAGRLGAVYPNATVQNYGVNGEKLEGLLAQMNTLQKSGQLTKADILLLQIGANDITYFTPLPHVDSELQQVLAKASDISNKVIIFHSGLVGDAPFFPPWLGWIWNFRTRAVRSIYIKDTAASGATYIDIMKTDIDKKFAGDPKKYYAADMFHPSGAGYGVWFEEVKKVL